MLYMKKIYIIFIFLAILAYIVGIAYLSRLKSKLPGLILPIISGLYAAYNFIKPQITYNPCPTMEEGIFMVFFAALSFIGFLIYFFTRHKRKGYK